MDCDFEDFDFDPDKISSFLKNKLMEIKSNNDKLEETITERKQYVEKLSEGTSSMDQSSIKIELVWKKIFNNKYSLGFYLENEANVLIGNAKVYMMWNSDHPLSYKVNIFGQKIYENNYPSFTCDDKECKRMIEYLNKTVNIEQISYVVLTIDLPKFTEKLEYEINGNIVVGDEKKINLKLPKVTISSSDTTDRKIIDTLLLTNKLSTLFTIITSSEVTEFMMIFPMDWGSNLENTFEIFCSMTKLNLTAKCRKYFIANRVSPIFDGSLLEIHAPTNENEFDMRLTLYTRDAGDSLLALCHHLFANIPNVCLVPRKLHINLNLENEKLIVIDDSEDILSSVDEFL